MEADLAEAIDSGMIAGAGVDVLCAEPIAADNPLGSVTHGERLIITPHIAWASTEARIRLMDLVYEQVKEFADSLK